ncbi:hypothetical protein BDZ89DRAFT_1080730 [Hymenopellis radicata]|nr:hypothetical protein BDZ89DRAFT_1080730 [Hymenopellis radicata]
MLSRLSSIPWILTSLTAAFNISNEIQILDSESTSQYVKTCPTASDTGYAADKSSAVSDKETRQSLSGGTIAGIIFGVLIFVIVIGVLVYLYYSRSRFSFRSQDMRHRYSSRVRDYLSGRRPRTKAPPPISADPEAYLPRLSPPRPVFRDGITVNGSASQKSSQAASITTLNVSPITERQSEIHQRLYELQDRLLRLQRNEELGDMSAQKAIEMTETKIVALRSFADSPWALHMTDEIPARLKQCL